MTPPRSLRTALIAVLTALVVGLVLAASVGSLPATCGSCHSMRPYADALAKTVHADTGCYACHLSSPTWDWPRFKADEVTAMYPLALIGSPVAGPGVRTTRSACTRCHAAVDNHLSIAKGLRISHRDCAPSPTACDECHTVHGAAARWPRQPAMEDCVLCHIAKGAPRGCDVCHTAKQQTERLANGPWQVTHGKEWRTTHGMGSIRSCVECHDASYCVQCHKTPLPHEPGFGTTHGKESAKPDAQCDQCHDRQGFCDACHGVPMPHGAGFMKAHPATAKGFSDPVCLKCHQQRDCDACHAKHTHPGSTKGTLGKPLPGVKGP